jgi:segregation and condensation protein B
MTLDSQIETILFFKGEPISLKELENILNKSSEQIGEALNVLDENLKERGVRLMIKDKKIMLGTAPEMSTTIEKMQKEELVKDLGQAGTETLAIVLYKHPITRSEIDYIRGVNSAFILRNLLIRGLVEKATNKKDSRSFVYSPTFKLLSYLGITKVEDLPEYGKVKIEIEKFNEAESKEE